MSAIGVVGGVGPFAGTDLVNKIFRHTKAVRDQDHINLIMTSCPSLIPDRTDFLLHGGEDPAPGIEKCIGYLASCGATAVGIACNTAHAPEILGRVRIPEGVKLINMIEQTSLHIAALGPNVKVGLLGTKGTIQTGVYDRYFESIVKPDSDETERVHDAIYNKSYGIKALPEVSYKAADLVKEAVLHLKSKGCSVVVLGCTELPLVFGNDPIYHGISLVDPTEILAIELIKATEPEKLI